MLIDFSVRNYLSFRSNTRFSMRAAKGVDYADGNTNSPPGSREKLLKSVGIYGTKDSGKTNLIRALEDVRDAVIDSFSDESLIESISQRYFKDDIAEVIPRHFEVTVLINAILYRYYFDVFNGDIVGEGLFKKSQKPGRETCCFKRNDQQVPTISRSFKGARKVVKKMSPKSLFVSSCAHFGVADAKKFCGWFSSQLVIPEPIQIYKDFYLYQSNPGLQRSVRKFMKFADLTISEGDIRKRAAIHAQNEKKFLQFFKSQQLVDYAKPKRAWQFSTILYMLYVLEKGGVLVLDEFGASLGFDVARLAIEFFQSEINKNSQLIFTINDAKLLRKYLFREDQIWLTEKDDFSGTKLYSVKLNADSWQAVAKNLSVNKTYLQRRPKATFDVNCLIKKFSRRTRTNTRITAK